MEIDVLVPTFNGEKYICEQIDSLLNQTNPNINIIIRDDCSTDSTYELICNKYKQHNNVIILQSENNGGYNNNIEYLLNYSTAETIFLCDQDDVWCNNKIIEISSQYVDIDTPLLMSHDVSVINSRSDIIAESYISGLSKSSTIFIDTFINTVQGCTISMNKKFKDLIKDITFNLPYDNVLGIASKVINAYKYTDKKYIKYRRHDNNASSALYGFDESYCKYRVTDIISSLTYIDEYIRICEYVKQRNGFANDEFIDILKKLKANKFKLINKIPIKYSKEEINTDNYDEVKNFYLSVINYCEKILL